MSYTPLGDRVLIRPIPKATQTASGLHLVEDFTPDVQGTVVAAGKDVTEVRVGDEVLFSWRIGQELRVGDERFLVMREADLLAVCERTV